LLFRKIDLVVEALELPPKDRALPFRLALEAPRRGTLTAEGALSPSSMDAGIALRLRGWDVLPFRPYFEQKSDVVVTHGTLGVDCQINVSKGHLHAPGTIRLADLDFDARGGTAFLGLPARTLLSILSNQKGELEVSFALDGDLRNPRFQLHQSLLDQLGTRLSEKLGVPLAGKMGKGLLEAGSKGLKGLRELFGGPRR
jgi:hypothetical protein